MTPAILLSLVALAANRDFAPDQSKLPVPPPMGATLLLDDKGNHSFLSMAGEKINWPVQDGVVVIRFRQLTSSSRPPTSTTSSAKSRSSSSRCCVNELFVRLDRDNFLAHLKNENMQTPQPSRRLVLGGFLAALAGLLLPRRAEAQPAANEA